ncbi:toll/interleukin-1 receptor domain-containing protein [Streptomyces sp. NPDC059517]|uniref:toll/interleukin-1 receptor domain-containing protein n=1 Tax=Streptomyces sp. NPDC059517 TaxID=3346855 RepID=UPI00367604D4
MHEIFINYRTKSGKPVAYMCDEKLSARFGPDSVFLARKSIDPGDNYIETLDRAARRSRVLLAVIDEHWLDAPQRHEPAKRALDDPKDWVRREIEEALSSGALVIPLLIGRQVEQLDPHRLPASMAELAECQYSRLELHTLDADLTGLGDRLVRQVPGLAALDRHTGPDATTTAEEPEPQPEPTVRNDHQRGGIGQVGGSVGTFVNDAHGPLHTGRGDVYEGPRIEGDGTNHVAGDNRGGIRQRFGPRAPRGGDQQ